MNCYLHPERDAIGVCVSCGKPVCSECKVELGGKYYCNPCAEKQYSGRIEAVPVFVNTSGQGAMAALPTEIRGWNWGAFLMGWIWGIGNNVWIAFLELIPYFGFIWAIVLGAKGTEWAWRSRRWESIEHFKRTQSAWAKWGIGLVVFNIALMIGLILLVFAFTSTTISTNTFLESN